MEIECGTSQLAKLKVSQVDTLNHFIMAILTNVHTIDVQILMTPSCPLVQPTTTSSSKEYLDQQTPTVTIPQSCPLVQPTTTSSCVPPKTQEHTSIISRCTSIMNNSVGTTSGQTSSSSVILGGVVGLLVVLLAVVTTGWVWTCWMLKKRGGMNNQQRYTITNT